MDLKVILYAIPEHMEKLTIKHVNQRRSRDNLCISVKKEDSQWIALMSTETYPLRVKNM